MSHAEKAFWYHQLKTAGWDPQRHYRMYSTEDLRDAYNALVDAGEAERVTFGVTAKNPPPQRATTAAPTPPVPVEADEPAPAGFFGFPDAEPEENATEEVKGVTQAPTRAAPSQRDAMAGTQQNTKAPEDVIRIDEEGRHWLQEEVLKPAFPKPRGRRVLRYQDAGVKKETVKVGEYTETFEVAGDPRNATPSEIKITLPSYQVGIYRDKRYPFKVITYNGKSGFDRLEVEEYYGGAELVPPIAKRTYVENVLCYDMRSVIRAINEEFRTLQLSGRV